MPNYTDNIFYNFSTIISYASVKENFLVNPIRYYGNPDISRKSIMIENRNRAIVYQ